MDQVPEENTQSIVQGETSQDIQPQIPNRYLSKQVITVFVLSSLIFPLVYLNMFTHRRCSLTNFNTYYFSTDFFGSLPFLNWLCNNEFLYGMAGLLSYPFAWLPYIIGDNLIFPIYLVGALMYGVIIYWLFSFLYRVSTKHHVGIFETMLFSLTILIIIVGIMSVFLI